LPKQILEVPILDRARNAFLCHYVHGFSQIYDVIDSLYQPGQGPLAAGVDAVSLAFFAFQFQEPQAATLARHGYLQALSLLHETIARPALAVKDSTLLAVLLLDLFEKITNREARCSEAWMSHVNGALALVRLRDHDHLKTAAGVRLSVRLATNLIASCIAADEPIPNDLCKLHGDVEPFLQKDDPKWRLLSRVIQFANLKASISKNEVDDAITATRAMCIDRELVSILQELPRPWYHETIQLQQPSDRVLGQQYHTYSNHFVTQTLNILRCLRILLHALIKKSVLEQIKLGVDVSSIHHYREAMASNVIDCTARDICASLPQYTLAFAEQGSNLQLTDRDIRCYTLLWPLYVAGAFSSPSTRIKEWVMKQTRYMSSDFRIRDALTVTNFLELESEPCPWMVRTLLGTYAFAA
jgi:hypothetical protein